MEACSTSTRSPAVLRVPLEQKIALWTFNSAPMHQLDVLTSFLSSFLSSLLSSLKLMKRASLALKSHPKSSSFTTSCMRAPRLSSSGHLYTYSHRAGRGCCSTVATSSPIFPFTTMGGLGWDLYVTRVLSVCHIYVTPPRECIRKLGGW